MNPGDSLVDTIFEKGLKGCDAMIVVLSNHSITSKWVRDELNVGMVKKIEGKTKLIPVRLDRCEVPECLLNTIWQDVPDLQNYDQQFERIVNTSFGQFDKPPLGERPPYVRPDVLEIGDLTRIDSLICEAACRMAIEEDSPLINPDPLVTSLAEQGVSESHIMETQEILANRAT
jgi:hypothetical protein